MTVFKTQMAGLDTRKLQQKQLTRENESDFLSATIE